MVRVNALPLSPTHEQVLVRLYEGWRAAGARVAGIQIDFDAATRQLDRYGNALQQLRRALPPGCKLSVTGLLDWAKTGDVAELNRLPVDELVIQTYQGTRTVPGYQAYLPAMAHLTIPFKVGLVQDGEWDPAWQTTLAASPTTGARWSSCSTARRRSRGPAPLFPGMTPTETRVNPIGAPQTGRETRMTFVEMNPAHLPLALLLEADPAASRIAAYLPGAWGFAALADNEVVGACVAGLVGEQTAEIFNIAVAPNRQQQGIGSGLLRFVLENLAGKGIGRVELGTGSFGHQLTYYQRHGFRVHAVVKDHFLIHYPEPLMEHGIQHKDMLRLSLALAPDTASP